MGAMAEEADEEFDTADAGSSDTYPTQAGELRKGSHVMIKGHPCKVAEVSTSKTGKHGHAKCHIVALDIFTSKKYEDLCPAGHNIEVPFIKRTEMQCLSAEEESGVCSLLKDADSGETKDDLNLPNIQVTGQGEPTDEDKKLTKLICEDVEKGEKDVFVVVLEACGQEKIVAHMLKDPPK